MHDAYWFEALSWQGGGVVHGELERTGPGVWRTDEPMPLAGDWKTLVRLHTPLHGLAAAPVYLPADPAIPAAEHPRSAAPGDLVAEQVVLRRGEAGRPRLAWGAGYGVVGSLFLALFATVAAGYSFAGRRDGAAPGGWSPSPGGSPRSSTDSPRWPRRSPACRGGSPGPGRREDPRRASPARADRRPPDAEVTVVLAHCWTSDHDAWRYQVRDLRTWFGDAVRVIGYDHRGHGASDECPQEAATIENLGRDLAAGSTSTRPPVTWSSPATRSAG